MKHSARDPRWMGRPHEYQEAAQRSYALDSGRMVLPWSWITTSCDLPMCLSWECMTVHAPTVIQYPAGVCVYCGDPAGTKDHLLPGSLTGPTLRRLVAVVPACADCNSRINDYPSPSVTERRHRAQASIRRKYAGLLTVPDKTPDDLKLLGPGLRSVAVKNNNLRRAVRLRLEWPDDPYYDLRAFQRSGIDDPYALGLVGARLEEMA